MNKIIEKTKIWFSISLVLILIGVGFMMFKGLNYGIDFKGGTQITVQMKQDFVKGDVDKIIDEFAAGKYSSKVINDGEELEIVIQEGILDETQVSSLIEKITEKYSLEEGSYQMETIGATVGKELQNNAIVVVIAASIAMLIYISIRFEFSFAMAAIIALIHDILITLAVYAVVGIQINTPFIAAMLTIVGYSINDTIVVFDRIRENRKKFLKASPTEVANMSIKACIRRSINTSLTTLITITCLFIFVPAIRPFSLPLIIGIASGAYSSIFIAAPIWVIFKNAKAKKKAKIRNGVA
ncbi:MAG: protein translocase subunit SecF [Clostridium sp.]